MEWNCANASAAGGACTVVFVNNSHTLQGQLSI